MRVYLLELLETLERQRPMEMGMSRSSFRVNAFVVMSAALAVLKTFAGISSAVAQEKLAAPRPIPAIVERMAVTHS